MKSLQAAKFKMDLQISQQLEYPQSQQYDIITEYASPSDSAQVGKETETNELLCNKPIHNCTHRKRHKILYPSPIWRRDSTNRLQRKSLRRSTSFATLLDVIDDYNLNECVGTDSNNSIHINSPQCPRVQHEGTTQLRKELKSVQNSKIFNSTTNRLQRKSLRKSTSFESSLDEIDDYELNESVESNTLNNSIHINSPQWQRVQYECTTKLRKDLMPVQNRKIFNSTMKTGYSRKSLTETNDNSEILNMDQDTSPANNRRNHTGKFKIFNSWIEWTPFWSREEQSKRLDRRHYISDFFDYSMDLDD